MKKAIDIIELAKVYYFLSNVQGSKPLLVGNRIKLEFALQKVKSDMIIATTGNDKKCLIIIDYTPEECWALMQKSNRLVSQLRQLKARN